MAGHRGRCGGPGPDGLAMTGCLIAGQRADHDLVAMGVQGHQRLDACRRGQGQQGADRAEDGAARDHRPKRDRRVQRHRAGGDARGQHQVLELLVEGDEDEHPHGVDRILEQGDQHR